METFHDKYIQEMKEKILDEMKGINDLSHSETILEIANDWYTKNGSPSKSDFKKMWYSGEAQKTTELFSEEIQRTIYVSIARIIRKNKKR